MIIDSSYFLFNEYKCVRGADSLHRPQNMFTISDIYKDDVPDDTVFVLEYPSSYKPNFGNPAFLVNSSRYLVSYRRACDCDYHGGFDI